nr:hypothetical protein [Candidatus Sigynarchaeota archaeon]
MPKCIFVIAWDAYEGAIVTHQFPKDTVIDINNVQTIDVAHQFHLKDSNGSPWIVVEDKDLKAVSYYNEPLQKAIALILEENEIPSTFVKFLEQLAQFVLPVKEASDVEKRLQEAFALIQAEIPVTEVVLLNFAHQIEQLKEELLDIKYQARGIMEFTKDLPTKLLMFLFSSDGSSSDRIENEFVKYGFTKAKIKARLKDLLDRGYIKLATKEQRYSINPAIEEIAHEEIKRETSNTRDS